jgi:hypothetical protein
MSYAPSFRYITSDVSCASSERTSLDGMDNASALTDQEVQELARLLKSNLTKDINDIAVVDVRDDDFVVS